MSGVNTGGAAAPSEFDNLMKSLKALDDGAETLAKGGAAAVVDDTAVAAAAAAGGAEGAAGAGGEAEIDDEDEENKGETFGKSLIVTGADGKEQEAIDATDFLKSLAARADSTDGMLVKGFRSIIGTMVKQGDLIKSLQGQIATLSGTARPRRAVLTGVEKTMTDLLAKGGAGGETEGAITASDLLAKSDAAWKNGKITGIEFNTLDSCLRHHEAVPEAILRKVAAA
jgi:hypothetical protein